MDACLELLQTKYLKAAIHYQGVQRIENFPVPEAAWREVLLNAMVHRDYAVAAPVQIRVYEDKLNLWNPAVLPQGWTVEKLRGDHPSIPFNPDIANTFFRAGEIEAWGRGIYRIFEACRDAGTPEPRFSFETGEFFVEFRFSSQYLKLLGVVSRSDEKTPEAILMLLRKNPTLTLAEIAGQLGKSTSAIERAAAKLRQQGSLRYEGPKKGGRWEVLR